MHNVKPLAFLWLALLNLALTACARSEPLRFDYARGFSEGLAAVAIDGKVGYIDATGAFVIEPRFEDGGAFSGGLAAAKSGGTWGFIDRSGAWVIESRYSSALKFAPGEDGVAVVEVGEFPEHRFLLIDRQGRVVLEPPEGGGHLGPNRYSVLNVRFSDRSLVIDTSGEVVWAFHAPDLALGDVGDGWASVYSYDLLKFGYIDWQGKVIIPFQYDYASAFDEGLAYVMVGDKWGYIDRSGRIVIAPIYDNAFGFSEGMASVKVGEKWASSTRPAAMWWNPASRTPEACKRGGRPSNWTASGATSTSRDGS